MALNTVKIVSSDKIRIIKTKFNSLIDEFINFSFDGSGNLTFGKNLTISGSFSAPVLSSSVAIGTSPLTIISTTKVSNLNVDQVDGYDFDQSLLIADSPTFLKLSLTQDTGTSPLTIISTTKVSNLNVDQVDGYDFDQSLLIADSPTFDNLLLTTALKLNSSNSLLYADANYQFDVRNSTNPCIFNVYGTYTGSTNYERSFIRSTASAGEIGTEKGSGGGTARPLNLYTNGVKRAELTTIGKFNLQSGSDTDLDIDEVYVSEISGGYGLIMVKESVNEITAVLRVDNETLTSISVEATFTITKDNASTINIYYEDNVLKVQNKTVSDDLSISVAFYGIL